MADLPRPLLTVEGLSLAFGGIRALRGVGFSLAEGETLAVIGPNGSGKTSLFNCISGAYTPGAGSITFQGKSLLGLSPDRVARRGIARTFQNLRLFLGLPVIDNLLLGRHLHFRKNLAAAFFRLRGEEIRHREKCEELIEFLDLEPYRNVRVADCAYGVQKRVELARALALEPRLLLLDEPASGLTGEEKEEVAYWLHEMRGRFGLTLLFVEHDLRFASRLAPRMIALDRGEKIAEGTPAEVQRQPAVARAYLGDAA
ncbi:MAG: ABC transporter ATP-binding protein [Myxococcales bacterium]|nr:ABC transporter ATP-binding protein [Myxococcales bacterium]